MLRLLPLLLLLLCTPACDDSTEGSLLEADEFALLDVMLQIDIEYKSIEPNLRDLSVLEETAEAATRIIAWSDDFTFGKFVESERFYSDPERFFALRDEMKAGAQLVLDGAKGERIDDVREGFIQMKQSCIACHKRFSPSY